MKNIILFLTGLFLAVSLNGCGEETPGEKLDKAIDSTKEASNNAISDIKKALND